MKIKTENNGGNGGNGGNLVGNKDDNGANTSIYVTDELKVIEKLVFEYLRYESEAKAKAIAEAIGVSERSVNRACKNLKDKGYIKREGSTRGRWVVLR